MVAMLLIIALLALVALPLRVLGAEPKDTRTPLQRRLTPEQAAIYDIDIRRRR